MRRNMELTDNTKEIDGVTHYQIRAAEEIYTIDELTGEEVFVEKGELGGYVESEKSLPVGLNDDSWIDKDSVVTGQSQISGDSYIEDSTIIDSDVSASKIGKSKVNQSVIHGTTIYESDVTLFAGEHTEVTGSKIYDSEQTYGDMIKNSEVIESDVSSTEVHDSTIKNTTMINSLATKGARIENAYTNDAWVSNSRLKDSSLDHVDLDDSFVYNSDLNRRNMKEDRFFSPENTRTVPTLKEETVVQDKQTARVYQRPESLNKWVSGLESEQSVSLTNDDLADLNESNQNMQQ